jgi:hypothetical protein
VPVLVPMNPYCRAMESSAMPERWLSTHEAADAMGCHPQTVRDRCARGELSFTVDPASGHRRIAASELEARGYALHTGANGHAPRRTRPGFHASLVADVEGMLTEGVVEAIAERLATVLAEREEKSGDERLAATIQRLSETQAALQAVARARFWQRPRVLARLRVAGILHELT